VAVEKVGLISAIAGCCKIDSVGSIVSVMSRRAAELN